MKSRIIALAVSALCCGFMKAETEEVTYDYVADGVYYKILEDQENCVEVASSDRSAPETLIIPSKVTINGSDYTVVKLGYESLQDCRNSKNLLLPSTLKVIEPDACIANFEYVEFPQNLEVIGSWAFYSNYLNSIIIPDKVSRLPDESFRDNYTAHTMVLGRGIKSLGHEVISSEVWNIREHWKNESLLKDLYVLAPEAPEFDYDAKPFCDIDNLEDITVYIPEGSLESYTAYKEPVIVDHPDYPYDNHGWQWWTHFKKFKTIPDLFIVIGIPYDVSLKQTETRRIFSTVINYADVTILSDKWEYDPAVIRIENDVITAVGGGETEAKRIIETSTGKYESKPIAIKVKGASGVELPVVEAKPEAAEAASTTDADHFFFTIDGIPAGSNPDRLAPGIYIEHDHGKTRKFIKR